MGIGLLYHALPMRAQIQISLRISEYIVETISDIIKKARGVRESWREWVKIHEKVKRETVKNRLKTKHVLASYRPPINPYLPQPTFYVIKIR